MNQPHHDIPTPCRIPANPKQTLVFDNRDDRLEIGNLLKSLSPLRRVEFLHWACQHAYIPNSTIHPKIQPVTIAKMQNAMRTWTRSRHTDGADESLFMEILTDVLVMAQNYSFDLAAALAHLTLMARGKA